MTRLQWEALPPGRIAAVENLTGPILKAETVTGGLMPGLTAVLHTQDSRYFLKAAPEHNPAYRLHQREMTANAALPPGTPAPPMLFASGAEGWTVMLFAYHDSADADLSPSSPDLPGTLTALRAINTAPAPASLPPVAANVTALHDKAARLPGADAGYPWNMYRAATSGFTDDHLTGNRLLHYDLHPGNLKASPDGTVTALDWAFACSGAPWIDAALLAPRLIQAGHSPAATENLLSQLPAYQAAPAADITAIAALWTMFREYKALHGPRDDRAFRARAAQAGRSWISHRTC